MGVWEGDMHHRLSKLMLLFACLLLPRSLGSADDQPRIRFAVIPWQVQGIADLGTAIAFDLEKRLERWPSLEAGDRLDLGRVLRQASTGDEKSVVAGVLEKLRADVVVVIAGSGKDGELRLTVELWKTAASPARSFPVSGKLHDLFRCQDELTANAVAALRSIYPSLPAPTESARLKLHPAGSFDAWMLAIRGKLAMEKGDNAEARSLLGKSLEEDPKLWWSHYWLGAVEFHEGDYRKAIEQCKATLALDSDLYPAIYANLAYCHAGLGDDAQAQKYRSEFERRTGKRLAINTR